MEAFLFKIKNPEGRIVPCHRFHSNARWEKYSQLCPSSTNERGKSLGMKSSSWIWMRGIDKAITDVVLDPVTPDDDRPSVHDLIKDHADQIEEVRGELKQDPLFEKGKHDALWILRFLLSHNSQGQKSKATATQRALQAAKDTLLFRKKYNLDEQDIRGLVPHRVTEDDHLPHFPYICRYWKIRAPGDSIVCTIPDKERGAVIFLKFSTMNNDTDCVEALFDDIWNGNFIFSSEWAFQWLDFVTRTTGRMTKSVRFLDMQGISFWHLDRDIKAGKRDAKVMGMVSLFQHHLD